ncbi:MAG: ATPase, T2SS/T4P/T4SS family, partial [Pseudomonadota bacterium]|nr:ATPase, T2SS/T4P/T4SS family [Pseudomonadota bacterium]
MVGKTAQQTMTDAIDVSGNSAAKKKGLCDYLIESGKLSPANAERALRLQGGQDLREPIGAILVKLGYVTERNVAECLAAQLALPLVEAKNFPEELPTAEQISHKFLQDSKTLILAEDDEHLTVVMADPLDTFVTHALKLLTGKEVLPQVGIATEIEQTLAQSHARKNDAGDSSDTGNDSAGFLGDVEHLKELASEAPIIKLVNLIINRAAESGASDIHIEPFENQLKVRYRIDGLLREMDTPLARSTAAVVSRIKIMANLNIAERRLPQDGRFRIRARGSEVDLRVSTVPTLYGESVVMRLLQRDNVALEFGPLGFSAELEQRMREILAMPHGILLVTGPTGSGKSTTLYAALKHINTPER